MAVWQHGVKLINANTQIKNKNNIRGGLSVENDQIITQGMLK